MPELHETIAEGLNVIVYPSNLVGASRVGKVAKSLQSSGLFAETHAVGMGIAGENLPAEEELSAGVKIKRVPLANLMFFGGWTLAQLLWPRSVVRRYAKQPVRVVSAQRASVLPLVYRIARKTGAVFAYNAHELETEVLGFTGFKQKVFKFIERRYIKHVDVISVVNESIADWYMNEYPGIPQPVVLTNTPIDDGNSIDMRSKLGIPDDELLYVHVGYISPGRNVPLILEAFAANPQVHVVFLGDGDLRHLVEEAAKKHENIHWHPMVDPDEVVAHVRGADIGLCLIESAASLSDELSTPNKLLESWVAGIPPLCSGLQEAKRLLGPELSKTWVLESPETETAAALGRLGIEDISDFNKRWAPVPTWESQAIDLVDAYRTALHTQGK